MADFKDEQEYQDSLSRSYFNIPEQSEFESMSDIKLAEKQAGLTSEKPALIIIQNEWRRREKFEQHKLNQELIEIQNKTSEKLLIKQHKLCKEISKSQNRTIIIASLLGIFGVIVGVILTNITNKPQVQDSQQTIMQTPTKEDHLNNSNEKTGKAKGVSSQIPPKKNIKDEQNKNNNFHNKTFHNDCRNSPATG